MKQFLREWRKFRKLSLANVSELIEIDHSTLSRVERGQSPYDQDILEKLSLVYGCEPPDLLAINPMQPDPPKLVYDRLRAAPPAVRERALIILDALLKAG
jgi:transcriptional regulator with XRE-family HTH domain